MDKPRVAWVDFAKGICIIAVVTMYASTCVKEMGGGNSPWVLYLVKFAKPFRMPDFFLISGLFLSRVIDRPLRSYLDKKVIHFMYFFSLWTTIVFAVLTLQGRSPSAGDYLSMYYEPFHMLWFIEMLPIYFVVTRMLRGVPAWIVLPLAAALQMANPSTGQVLVDRFGDRYVFFYTGYVFAPHVFRFASWALEHGGSALGALIGWAAINGWLTRTDLAFLPGINLILGYAGAGAVIAASCLLSRYRTMDWLRSMGQNSIVVFLSFYFPMYFATQALIRTVGMGQRGIATLIVTAVAVASSLLLHRVVQGTPARYLFIRPEWARLGNPRAPAEAPLPAAA